MAERRVPLGKPLDLTDEDLAALSEVSPADIAEAQSAFRRHAPADARDLLDATEEEDGE